MAVPETTGVKNAGGITRFMRETKVELKKVTWPTKQELIANTAVVLIAVVICASSLLSLPGCVSWKQQPIRT